MVDEKLRVAILVEGLGNLTYALDAFMTTDFFYYAQPVELIEELEAGNPKGLDLVVSQETFLEVPMSKLLKDTLRRREEDLDALSDEYHEAMFEQTSPGRFTIIPPTEEDVKRVQEEAKRIYVDSFQMHLARNKFYHENAPSSAEVSRIIHTYTPDVLVFSADRYYPEDVGGLVGVLDLYNFPLLENLQGVLESEEVIKSIRKRDGETLLQTKNPNLTFFESSFRKNHPGYFRTQSFSTESDTPHSISELH
ncbi:hypothetical protein GOV05_04295 [Candidatus Woesearchaeota archaeon]|nr:hypothetical protein [Candidatus Woesearchaeota archaeon]